MHRRHLLHTCDALFRRRLGNLGNLLESQSFGDDDMEDDGSFWDSPPGGADVNASISLGDPPLDISKTSRVQYNDEPSDYDKEGLGDRTDSDDSGDEDNQRIQFVYNEDNHSSEEDDGEVRIAPMEGEEVVKEDNNGGFKEEEDDDDWANFD